MVSSYYSSTLLDILDDFHIRYHITYHIYYTHVKIVLLYKFLYKYIFYKFLQLGSLIIFDIYLLMSSLLMLHGMNILCFIRRSPSNGYFFLSLSPSSLPSPLPFFLLLQAMLQWTSLKVSIGFSLVALKSRIAGSQHMHKFNFISSCQNHALIFFHLEN